MDNQGILFLIYVIVGLFIGFVFDLFRALRKSIKTSNIVTYIEDIIFWIIVGFVVIGTNLKFNYGELRLYIFLGILLGAVVYFLILSKNVVKFTTAIINFFIKIFSKIKVILFKIFGKPIKFVIINLRKLPAKKNKNKKNKNLSKIV